MFSEKKVMASPSVTLSGYRPRYIAYAQLVRLPNVFTAISNICLGATVTSALPSHWLPFACIMLASACLYAAGMVWNDYFDFEQDKKERPFRPLPSGRISRSSAAKLGGLLVLLGLLLVAIADWRGDGLRWYSLTLGLLLSVAIFLYDAWWKRTWMGPVGMGLCRLLNVLLGLSIATERIPFWGFLLALVVGVYVAGVTWFAKTEARESNRNVLWAAAAVMALGLSLSVFVPASYEESGAAAPGFVLFPYLLVAFGVYVGMAAARAIDTPTPARVQPAVKRAVLGLIVLDALLASALVGAAGLLIALLLIPAHLLGRWIYST